METSRTPNPSSSLQRTPTLKVRGTVGEFDENNKKISEPGDEWTIEKEPDEFANIMMDQKNFISDPVYDSLDRMNAKNMSSMAENIKLEGKYANPSDVPESDYVQVEDNYCDPSALGGGVPESDYGQVESQYCDPSALGVVAESDYGQVEDQYCDPSALKPPTIKSETKKISPKTHSKQAVKKAEKVVAPKHDVSTDEFFSLNDSDQPKFVIKDIAFHLMKVFGSGEYTVNKLNDPMSDYYDCSADAKNETNSQQKGGGSQNMKDSNCQKVASFSQYDRLPPREHSKTYGIIVGQTYKIKRKNYDLVNRLVEAKLRIGDDVEIVNIPTRAYYCNARVPRLSETLFIPMEYISDEFYRFLEDDVVMAVNTKKKPQEFMYE